jgi:hypothetical protein
MKSRMSNRSFEGVVIVAVAGMNMPGEIYSLQLESALNQDGRHVTGNLKANSTPSTRVSQDLNTRRAPCHTVRKTQLLHTFLYQYQVLHVLHNKVYIYIQLYIFISIT